MNKKVVLWFAFGALALTMTILQFIPSAPVQIPAQLAPELREAHRLINFEGIDNFRDLGGYPTEDGRQVKWGSLYRSANFARTSRADQQVLAGLNLHSLIDFRSTVEKEEEPSQFMEPAPFPIVEIPTLDGRDRDIRGDILARMENGDFENFDPNTFMLNAYRQFAIIYTPQYSQFLQVILNAAGEPVVWHCSAGKDRTGYAAAILLRILGVPMELILSDYALSKEYVLAAKKRDLMLTGLFKGEEVAAKIEVLLGVEKPWLQSAFDEIDAQYGDFNTYVRDGLGLSEHDIAKLQSTLLE